MKNVIVVLVDSVFSECLSTNKTQTSSTPFIDSLVGNAIFAPNVYSYGPYTDAASKALYCGNRTLDDYGYFFGLNSTEYNHFRVFHENGYETYGLYYPYYILGKSVEKQVDHPIYTGGFKYTSVWGGKFDYYARIKRERDLTETEYRLLIHCMHLVFESWMGFYDNLEKEGASDIVKRVMTSSESVAGRRGLESEIRRFEADSFSYIDEVLSLGMNHPLATVNDYDCSEKNVDFLRKVYKKNAAFFKRVARKNAVSNLIHNPISVKKAIRCLCNFVKTGDKAELRYFGNYGMLLCYTSMMKKRSLEANWQDLASLNRQIEVLFENLDKRNPDDERPFYASIHALEPHHNISFFSYDSFDHDLVSEELDYLAPVIKGRGRKFSGNLLYQLSLRYVDLCIKKLYDRLDKRGMLNNTTIMLVSDHGTSYAFDPVRTRVVNTFHKENYNIPLLIWDSELDVSQTGVYYAKFCSDDVFPTLLDVLGLDCPTTFSGQSILKNPQGRDYIITEYMGPGVPDMLQKEVWMSIRNEKYVIAYKNAINKELNMDTPVCVYNLVQDPREKKNVALKTEDNDEILWLKSKIKKRYDEIRESTQQFLKEATKKEKVYY